MIPRALKRSSKKVQKEDERKKKKRSKRMMNLIKSEKECKAEWFISKAIWMKSIGREMKKNSEVEIEIFFNSNLSIVTHGFAGFFSSNL